MPTRRATLKHCAAVSSLLVTAGLLPAHAQSSNTAVFQARGAREALRALGASAPVESREITLDAPDNAPDGSAVPFTVATTLLGVRQLVVLVDKNPNAAVALFNLTDNMEPSFTLHAKMNESSDVYAVALLRDGRTLFARRNVIVTLGSCGA